MSVAPEAPVACRSKYSLGAPTLKFQFLLIFR
jgi:hypothetical protein